MTTQERIDELDEEVIWIDDVRIRASERIRVYTEALHFYMGALQEAYEERSDAAGAIELVLADLAAIDPSTAAVLR